MKFSRSAGIVFFIFTFLFILDVFSTLRVGVDLLPFVEVNPLINLGPLFGFLVIIFFNGLFIGAWSYFYEKSNSSSTRFYLLAAMVSFFFTRLFVVFNNWKIGNNPPTLEEAKLITQGVKNAALWGYMLSVSVPYLVSWVSFELFKLDHHTSILEVEE